MKSTRQRTDSRRHRRSFSLKTLLVVVTIISVIVAWRQYEYEFGTIRDWVEAVLAAEEANPLVDEGRLPFPAIPFTPCPLDISEEQQVRLLMKAATWLPTAERRNCVLKILAEQFPDQAHDRFMEIASTTKHDLLRRNAILLASLFRIESDAEKFAEHLDDENPNIRSAAVDAMGIVHKPAFPIPAGFDNGFRRDIVFLSEPRINLSFIASEMAPATKNVLGRSSNRFAWSDKNDRRIDSAVTNLIRKMMATDQDAKVRAAAARAMLTWTPQKYHLRVAEWGVWINQGENLTLAQSVIDEIPSFVHQAGNSISDIKLGRTNSVIIVTKPIIHIEVDQPLAIDLSVRITDGRPWFGYPMPDDFAVSGHRGGRLVVPRFVPPAAPDEMNLEKMSAVREGYPWVSPSHTKHYSSTINDVGFRWQSLIAIPEKARGMNLEPVTEEKYNWWNRLRDVPTSWVSSRGESERFLYYDGPTNHASPVVASIDAKQVEVAVPENIFSLARLIANCSTLKLKRESFRLAMTRGNFRGVNCRQFWRLMDCLIAAKRQSNDSPKSWWARASVVLKRRGWSIAGGLSFLKPTVDDC